MGLRRLRSHYRCGGTAVRAVVILITLKRPLISLQYERAFTTSADLSSRRTEQGRTKHVKTTTVQPPKLNRRRYLMEQMQLSTCRKRSEVPVSPWITMQVSVFYEISTYRPCRLFALCASCSISTKLRCRMLPSLASLKAQAYMAASSAGSRP